MPPAAVRSVRDLLFWQYAKIIADSARIGSGNFRFVMDRFTKLRSGAIEWSGSIREYVRERELADACIYCGSREGLGYDHLLPRDLGGPDVPENVVRACKRCNSSKGGKRFYEWWFEGAPNTSITKMPLPPRIAEGKYLKLLYALHEGNGTLEAGRADLGRLCSGCGLERLCERPELTVYCLESILRRA